MVLQPSLVVELVAAREYRRFTSELKVHPPAFSLWCPCSQMLMCVAVFFMRFCCVLWCLRRTGAIPASLGNMVTARKIFLNNNSIEGTLPATLGNLSSLRVSGLRILECAAVQG